MAEEGKEPLAWNEINKEADSKVLAKAWELLKIGMNVLLIGLKWAVAKKVTIVTTEGSTAKVLGMKHLHSTTLSKNFPKMSITSS